MSTKISQDQLRKLMKEKREDSNSQKVDSPFAKYSSLGQLSCSICNIVIKKNNLWVTHIIGKTHKENLQKSKKCSSDPLKNITHGTKRSSEQIDLPNSAKKVKTEVFKVPQVPISTSKSTTATNLLAGYSSSSDEELDENDSDTKTVFGTSKTKLPTDFFDSSISNETSSGSSKSEQAEKKDTTSAASNKSETLPEGFFDDPILDAKARNIEYRDPVEEEWERFKKSIAEESNVSKTIIEEDLEESIIERGINQIDEQIQQWERKIDLESLADKVKSRVSINVARGNESETSDDDFDEYDLLDWRSKSIKKV